MNFIHKLRIFLVFGILGFLYDGYEAWASIIGDIRKKLKWIVFRSVLLVGSLGLGFFIHRITDSPWGLVIVVGAVLLGFMVGSMK